MPKCNNQNHLQHGHDGFIFKLSDGLWNPEKLQGGKIIVPTSSMEKLVGAQPPQPIAHFACYLVGKMGIFDLFAHH